MKFRTGAANDRLIGVGTGANVTFSSSFALRYAPLLRAIDQVQKPFRVDTDGTKKYSPPREVTKKGSSMSWTDGS